MSGAFSLIELVEYKRKSIGASLARSVGWVIRAKNGVVLGIKSPNIYNFRVDIHGNCIFVWAICGSVSDKRDFESEFESFQSMLVSIFSERDLNIKMIQDFTAGYMQQNFYDIQSAKPLAAEFIIGVVSPRGANLSLVDYEGKITRLRKDLLDINMIGGGSDEAKSKLLKELTACQFKKADTDSIIKKVEGLLKENYDGDFGSWSFTIEKAGPTVKKNHDEKKKQKKDSEEKKRKTKMK